MAKNNNALARRVVANLDKETIDSLSLRTLKNRSRTINQIVAEHYKKLPAAEQNNLLRLYDEMTPEQIKSPRSL